MTLRLVVNDCEGSPQTEGASSPAPLENPSARDIALLEQMVRIPAKFLDAQSTVEPKGSYVRPRLAFSKK